jgi:signal transduction histidine kinase
MAADVRAMWARAREGLGSLRVRTTAAAILVVGASLVIASIAMVSFVEGSLRSHVRMTARIHAEAIEQDLGSQDLASKDGSSGVIEVGEPDEEFAQVIDADGNIVMASRNVKGRAPFARLSEGEVQDIPSVPFEDNPRENEPEEDEPFLAVAISAGPSESHTVIVGRSLESVTEASGALTRVLVVAVPLLLFVVGAVTWLVVGRALAPVDAIGAEVEAISSRELHRRVPDPRGRDEIARLAATMNRMLGRLEEAQFRQRRFVSDASHELRSPVASIRQHAEVALAHPEGSSVRELADVVLEEDVRLQRIVEDLLLLTRIDEGTLELRREPVDLDDLVFEEAARLKGSTNLTIDVAGVSAGRISGDRDKLERLVRNLSDNAARHARSTISLSLRDGGGTVVMAIDDDGSGIPVAQRERIFDRFVRLEDARDRDSGGSGLGLAIALEIATFHRGTVRVLDSALGGARFEVRLPGMPD